MTEREQLHQIVEKLPDRDIEVARRVLLALTLSADPVELAYLTAAPDDEPTELDDEGVQEALAEIEAGDTVSAEEAERILGIA